ncbi:MAG: tetratricopeptide repeat protein [Candidatus Obscuribacterales bacterium]|nr:tetratricopeptide repeat protein [Candidatus Obscuribacterales bacterium]
MNAFEAKRFALLLVIILLCFGEPIHCLAQYPPPGFDLAAQAMKHRNEGQFEQAQELINKALGLNPDLPEAHYVQGAIYFGEKRYQEAKTCFDKALQLKPKMSAALGDRARLKYLYLDDNEGALLDFDGSLSLFKDATNYWYRGQIYEEQKNFELAIKDFSSAIELDSGFVKAYRDRAFAYTQLRRDRDALKDYNTVIAANPIDTDYLNRGLIFFDLENFEKSVQDLRKAASLDPKWAGIKRAVEAYELYRAGRISEACKILSPAGTCHYSMEYYVQGCLNMRLGKYSSAIWDFRESIKHKPEFAPAYSELGLVKFLSDNDAKGALEDFQKSLSLSKRADTFLNRAMVYSRLNKAELALADLESAVKLDPNNRDILRVKATVSIGVGKNQDAISLFSKTIAEEPQASDYAGRAYAYFQSQQYEKAGIDLEKALELQPNSPSVHFALGVLREAQKKNDDAIAEYSSALKYDPQSVRALCARGRLYNGMRKYKEAFADYALASKVDGRNSRALIGAGIANLRLQNYDYAKQYFDAAVKHDPKNRSAFIWRAVLARDLAKYPEILRDSNSVLALCSNEPPMAWGEDHIMAAVLKADALMHLGKYGESVENCRSLLSQSGKLLDSGTRIAINRINNESLNMLSLLAGSQNTNAMIKAAGDYIAKSDPRAQMLDGLFSHRLATKHFLFLSNLPEARILFYAKFAEGFLNVVDSEYIRIKDAPITRIYLVANHKDFTDFVFHHFPEQHEARAAFFHGPNAIVFGDEDGIGVLAHEIMHKLIYENMPYIDKWASEGIPAFFEQIYGYWENEKLVLKLGLLNPLRIAGLSKELKSLSLKDALNTADVTQHEGRVGMVSMFLNHSSKFKAYLELARLNGKGKYENLVEAVFGQSLSELEKPWSEYMQSVEGQKDIVLRLLSCQIFPSKADFDEAEKQGFVDVLGGREKMPADSSAEQLPPLLR